MTMLICGLYLALPAIICAAITARSLFFGDVI
jgi:hypothetical protein